MRNKTFWSIMAICIVFLLTLSAMVVYSFRKSKEHPLAEDVDVLRMAVYAPYENASAQGARKFADLLYERTNGKIRVVINYITDERSSILEQVKFGGIDFVQLSTADLSDSVASIEDLLRPYRFNSYAELEDAYGNSLASINDAMRLQKMVPLTIYQTGPRCLFQKAKSADSPQDAVVVAVSPSQILYKTVQALGFEPKQFDPSKQIRLLREAQIDAVMGDYLDYLSIRKSINLSPPVVMDFQYVPDMLIASLITMGNFERADQEIILQAAEESYAFQRNAYEQAFENTNQEMRRLGVTSHAFDVGKNLTAYKDLLELKYR